MSAPKSICIPEFMVITFCELHLGTRSEFCVSDEAVFFFIAGRSNPAGAKKRMFLWNQILSMASWKPNEVFAAIDTCCLAFILLQHNCGVDCGQVTVHLLLPDPHPFVCQRSRIKGMDCVHSLVDMVVQGQECSSGHEHIQGWSSICRRARMEIEIKSVLLYPSLRILPLNNLLLVCNADLQHALSARLALGEAARRAPHFSAQRRWRRASGERRLNRRSERLVVARCFAPSLVVAARSSLLPVAVFAAPPLHRRYLRRSLLVALGNVEMSTDVALGDASLSATSLKLKKFY
ncbi:hypothetical protein MUK42_33846 [Musa troglodytarum]|uniref:Uncharacterized protein n=1 Tax=Musa troglodytarum TaxID=320322 RepID=A0A9E7EF00_9LILI|nr:hypothetical protein MUK42_33846 [Musa troglodytarum]